VHSPPVPTLSPGAPGEASAETLAEGHEKPADYGEPVGHDEPAGHDQPVGQGLPADQDKPPADQEKPAAARGATPPVEK